MPTTIVSDLVGYTTQYVTESGMRVNTHSGRSVILANTGEALDPQMVRAEREFHLTCAAVSAAQIARGDHTPPAPPEPLTRPDVTPHAPSRKVKSSSNPILAAFGIAA